MSSSVLFSAAVVLSALRRLAVATRRHHSRNAPLVGGVEMDLASLARNALLRTSLAVAVQVNPITPHHHTVWWSEPKPRPAVATVSGSGGADASCDGGGLAAISLSDRLAFFNAVREVQFLLSNQTGCTDFNLSWQEGRGQPPGRMRSWARYVHVVPRLAGDLEGDAVHELLKTWTWSPDVPPNPARPWPTDADRADRTPEVMAVEAARFRRVVTPPQPLQQQAAADDDDDNEDDNDADHIQTGFTFGRIPIPAEQVFFESANRSTVALVNLRPLRPGHVLVCPRRVAARLADLTLAEYEDLIESVWAVAEAFQQQQDAVEADGGRGGGGHRGFIFAVQDGPHANQSIPHVHVHLIPRA